MCRFVVWKKLQQLCQSVRYTHTHTQTHTPTWARPHGWYPVVAAETGSILSHGIRHREEKEESKGEWVWLLGVRSGFWLGCITQPLDPFFPGQVIPQSINTAWPYKSIHSLFSSSAPVSTGGPSGSVCLQTLLRCKAWKRERKKWEERGIMRWRGEGWGVKTRSVTDVEEGRIKMVR